MDHEKSLPSGTVTFLFTDIEGSTRLWEQHPQAMEAALTRHDALSAGIVAQHGGTLVKHRGEGDSLFAVFSSAIDAVSAAADLQCALTAESWPAGVELRVRMALHTGEAAVRDRDYFGAAINRSARLRAAAHGGQVLLSETTRDLIQDDLPSGLSLRDLGLHRLRDLQRPERIFQLLHLALPAYFPPLASLDAFPNNLPQQVTSFIGREREIEEVKRLLGTTRLLTLTGTGGTGKTRLALQVAADLLSEYPDGVWLVELASLADPSLVPQVVASVFSIREEAGKPLTQTLVEGLRLKTLLLVLDNCEHLLEPCAAVADALLRGCPGVQLLATSREGLNIPGEMPYRLRSLAAPDPRQVEAPESLTQYEAVHLFVERAQTVLPTFALTNQNAVAIAEICHRLDGIPLALELAASRVKALPVETLHVRLADMFRLLTGGSRTALPRQQTLRALIDWSYDLLSPREQTLLRRLSVFAAGWTLEAAEAVCPGDGVEEWEVLDLLASLVEKSMVGYEEHEARYRLLETMRQYARDRLVERGEAENVRRCHRDFFLRLAEEAKRKLQGGEQAAWLNRLEAEHDNLRVALDWCQVDPDGSQPGLRLATALSMFWEIRGHLSEGRARLAQMLALREPGQRTAAGADALLKAGNMAFSQGDYSAAHAFFVEGLETQQALGNRLGIGAALNQLGRVAAAHGDYAEARSLYERSLAMWRELGERRRLAITLNNLGWVMLMQGEQHAARPLFEESLALRREVGDRRAMMIPLYNLGSIALNEGNYGVARKLYEESEAISRELGDKWGLAMSLHKRAVVARAERDHTLARMLQAHSLTLRGELGDRLGIAECLEGFACLAAAQGQPERAARLWGAEASLRADLGAPNPPDTLADRERSVAVARQATSEETFETAGGRAGN
jgi:predicted ATPase/class 3 adenylate cyclase